MHSQTSRRIRRALAALALVLLFAAGYALVNAGRFLTHQDPLEKADAIYVLAGSFVDRPLEAARLHGEGWAPLIVMGYGIQESGIEALAKAGVVAPTTEDIARDLLIRAGTPPAAIQMTPRAHDNTADEAQTVRELILQRGWRRLIVVTSPYHLRRARYAFERELQGTGARVIMRGTRFEAIDPGAWWTERADIRWMLSELPKLGAYVLGLGA